MASQIEKPHFIVFPFMAQGHMTPMIDIARLLAQRGVIVTIVTTPHNATRFKTITDREVESGFSIRVAEFQFPAIEAGLPEGCENFDMLPSFSLSLNFFQAANMLEKPVRKWFEEELTPPPSCIISDVLLCYTFDIANQFQIPRIMFHGGCCFFLLCLHHIATSNILEQITSETEYFTVPNLPDEVQFTKSQVSGVMHASHLEFSKQINRTLETSYGMIINTFEELEKEYVNGYKKAKGDKVWCVGPVSLCNKDASDKAERGNKASVDGLQCLKWLDSQKPGSVIYACLGSQSNVIPLQSIELGLGLEASNRPFIWVIRGNDSIKDIEKWIKEDGFEERIKGRGFLIRGWAPQVLILSHPAVGGFLTHCGWNSTLEGISAGVPLVTWPLFADQFANEKLAVQILKIGVKVGVEEPLKWTEEERIGVLVKKKDVQVAIESLMDEGGEAEERRKRAKKIGETAKKAVEMGGSSFLNITHLIQHIMQIKI